MRTVMRSLDVRNLCQELDRLKIPVWVDGGWAVDALLGKQTRPHDDLDIVIEQKHLSRLCQYLRTNGYTDVPRDDTCAWNFVLGDNQGRQIDIHVISFLDDAGNGIYGPIENGVTFPAGSLTWKGTIEGYAVNCISPEQLVKFHTGYKLDRNDFLDVRAICGKFDMEMPEEHKAFWRASLQIRPFAAADFERLKEICLLAFGPIHESFRELVGPEIFQRAYSDWQEKQVEYLKSICEPTSATKVLVIKDDDIVVGFVGFSIDDKKQCGEIDLNAVHPDHAGKGIGKTMYGSSLCVRQRKML
jgi:lincosamide nucleotidyltransferase A/C/D/E